jgi:hypothetical protein
MECVKHAFKSAVTQRVRPQLNLRQRGVPNKLLCLKAQLQSCRKKLKKENGFSRCQKTAGAKAQTTTTMFGTTEVVP